MQWNPETYNQFKSLRFKPFFDLAALISLEAGTTAIDLGCGTGEQTALLAERFPESHFLGIDSSSEMLKNASQLETGMLQFKLASTEEAISADVKWDLIFSNAALQWSDNHPELFPKIISRLNKNGQLAVQMPYQPENILNQLLSEIANEEPFRSYLKDWNRPSTVLTIDAYTQLLFTQGLEELNISQRVYPIVANDYDILFEFISGSALIPYLARLDLKQQALFTSRFKVRIQESFPKLPAIYPFKRLLLYGKKA